jgi:hypothetical protein
MRSNVVTDSAAHFGRIVPQRRGAASRSSARAPVLEST